MWPSLLCFLRMNLTLRQLSVIYFLNELYLIRTSVCNDAWLWSADGMTAKLLLYLIQKHPCGLFSIISLVSKIVDAMRDFLLHNLMLIVCLKHADGATGETTNAEYKNDPDTIFVLLDVDKDLTQRCAWGMFGLDRNRSSTLIKPGPSEHVRSRCCFSWAPAYLKLLNKSHITQDLFRLVFLSSRSLLELHNKCRTHTT